MPPPHRSPPPFTPSPAPPPLPQNNLLNNLGLAPPLTLTLDLRPPPDGRVRPTALLRPRGGGEPEPVPLFVDGDTIAGEVCVWKRERERGREREEKGNVFF